MIKLFAENMKLLTGSEGDVEVFQGFREGDFLILYPR